MASPDHDHQICIQTALAKAETHCRQHGLRLTHIRRRVLELVWQSHIPVGAYDILSVLGAEGFCAAPPTVYRALDFLLEHHFIHRIARLNAFIGCNQPGHGHAGQFLICRLCGAAFELQSPDLDQALYSAASSVGFQIETHAIEADGLCRQCQNGQHHAG